VYCDGVCSRRFTDSGNFHRVDHIFIPALSDFHRDRNIYSIFHRGGNFAAELRGFHQRRAGAVAAYFWRGAAHVDVDDVAVRMRAQIMRRFGHGLRVAAEQLQGHRMLMGINRAHLKGLGVMVMQGLVADHLADAQGRPELAADRAESRAGDARHRRRDDRIGQFDVTDFPHGFSCPGSAAAPLRCTGISFRSTGRRSPRRDPRGSSPSDPAHAASPAPPHNAYGCSRSASGCPGVRESGRPQTAGE